MRRELLALATELSRQQQPYLVATVIWARGPSSGKRGSAAIVRPDGTATGWIGGACAEPAVLREAGEALQDGKPRILLLGTEEDLADKTRPDVIKVPISCTSEGALEVFLEPVLPAPHLVLVGGSPAVTTLTSLARSLDWRVTVVDVGAGSDDHPLADQVLSSISMPDDVTSATAVVVATQGHHDEPAIEAALASDAGYIGLVASAARAETLIGYLRDRGLPEEQLRRVQAPAGLDLGPIDHREIGVAILGELVRRRAAGELAGWAAPAAIGQIAVDPVCGMEVDPDGAPWSATHGALSYHFCSPRCMEEFEQAPADFVGV